VVAAPYLHRSRGGACPRSRTSERACLRGAGDDICRRRTLIIMSAVAKNAKAIERVE
jgi:hypothetical protein